MGTYIHGLFENPAIMGFWLQHIGLKNLATSDLGGLEARNREYDLLVEHFEKHIDVKAIVATVLG
jgi:adenosylcobyric acid synthase